MKIASYSKKYLSQFFIKITITSENNFSWCAKSRIFAQHFVKHQKTCAASSLVRWMFFFKYLKLTFFNLFCISFRSASSIYPVKMLNEHFSRLSVTRLLWKRNWKWGIIHSFINNFTMLVTPKPFLIWARLGFYHHARSSLIFIFLQWKQRSRIL